MLFRHRQLFARHIDPDYFTSRPDSLCQGVDVAAPPAAEIEHPAAFQRGRTHQAAAILTRQHFRMDAGQQPLEQLSTG